MIPKKLYNVLLALFPVVYLIHNAEEWYMFKGRIVEILNIIPANVKTLNSNDPTTISSVFGFALILATLIPLIVTIIIWNKVTVLNIKILIIIAFVALVNAISHISSSVILGFCSPGSITGIFVCIPFSIGVLYYIQKHYKFTIKQFSFFAFISFLVFAIGLVMIWLLSLFVILLI